MNHNNAKQNKTGPGITQFVTGVFLLTSALLVLSACGGGADNPQNPYTGGGSSVASANTPPPYTGPAPSSQDTLYFSKYLWNNLRTQNHCASCHDVGGQGGVYFADNSNVNNAYAAVMNSSKPLVNLQDPAASVMVTKFSQGGHFCLDGTNAVCAQELTNWITAWANAENGTGSTTVTLTAPAIHAPSAPLTFPTTVPSTYDGVYNLVQQHCSGCHVPDPTLNATPVAPEFATNSESDSYSLASSIPLIDLADPTKSRFYTRLAVDGHNCWTDCATAAAQMLNAIKAFTDPIQQAAQSAPSATSLYLASDAVNLLQDGIVASGGGRYEASQIALYNFKVGSGNTILDVSGVAPAMNLTLSGIEGTDFKWMSNWGIEFDTKNAKAQAQTSDSAKLTNMIGLTGAYSIEAWVAPANTTQTMSDIVTYTGGTSGNNFSLGQNASSYEAYNRDTANDPTGNGSSQFDVPGLNASLQHVVLTFDPIHGRNLYINGILAQQDTSSVGENLGNWDSNFALVLGNDPTLKRSWLGQIRMLAIHNSALTAAQVKQNFDAGVGQKYYLLFNISRYLGPECNPSSGPSCFIVMQASVYDNSSYLLTTPTFINLNDATVSTEPSIFLKGMRIGINGSDTSNDQVFSSLDVCINGACPQSDANTTNVTYTPGSGPNDGAQLSSQGAVIAMQNGPEGSSGDMLFLTFQQIDANLPNTPYVVTSVLSPPIPAVNPVASDNVLIHSFEEINATLSALTGVPRTNSAINDDSNSVVDCGIGVTLPCSGVTDGAYTTAIQALPSTHDASTFNAANQMAITQLAIAYCDQMVSNQITADQTNGNTNKFFPNITFDDANKTITTPSSGTQSGLAFTTNDINDIVQPLLTRVMNVDYTTATPTELSFMPSASSVSSYLSALIAGGIVNGTTVSGLTALTTPTACGTSSTDYCSYDRSIQIIKGACAAAVASAPMLLH